jgi:group I intron endonuclease
MEKKPGVYRLQNIITGRFYIGSTKNIYARFYRHMQCLRQKIYDNERIKEDNEKHGKKSFIFGVVEYCDENQILDREKYYFDLWQPQYNIFDPIKDRKGFKHSENSIMKMKEARKKKIWDENEIKEHSKRLKKAWIIRRQSSNYQEGIDKMVKGKTGHRHTEETKKRYSEMRKGITKSKEHCEKVRKAKLGTKLINGKFVKMNEVW